ncbi:DUF2752 domain-containing protein [Serinibacter arcticus]|uniref:DUF2752 domain-containing protein n=1 Tax=Serinibacter arcticus TaxID=1655435 RepID=A0A2U1ZRM0_9MICO|nr:DUF2752 domain-containing protein [Serinibacter arcticus]PWD49601.1 DUF2752 domain-containing protein [Serinibacter arcticus]
MTTTADRAGPRTARSRPASFLRPGAVLVAAGAALTVLAVRDPLTPGHYPTCPFLSLTGLACPGCGSMRALYHLTQGDVAAMWAYNPLAVLAVVLLAGIWVAWVVRLVRGRERTRVAPAWLLLTFAAGVLAYGVARNVPVLTPFLGPLGVG